MSYTIDCLLFDLSGRCLCLYTLPHGYVSLCLSFSVSVSVCFSMSVSVSVSLSLSESQFLSISLCFSASLYVCLCMSLSLSICLSVFVTLSSTIKLQLCCMSYLYLISCYLCSTFQELCIGMCLDLSRSFCIAVSLNLSIYVLSSSHKSAFGVSSPFTNHVHPTLVYTFPYPYMFPLCMRHSSSLTSPFTPTPSSSFLHSSTYPCIRLLSAIFVPHSSFLLVQLDSTHKSHSSTRCQNACR